MNSVELQPAEECIDCLVRGGMDFHWFFEPGWLIFFPLVGSLVLMFFGRRLGRAAGAFASTMLGLSFLLGCVLFAAQLSTHAEGRNAHIRLYDWIVAGDFGIGFDLALDQLSLVMVLVVSGVGTLIHVYSIGYMHDDPRYSRYFAYLNLFAASMLLLVLADNLLVLYVGWEGVGLCSYLLIGFWFERRAAHNAAKKAFLVNRIGDFAFLLGLLLLAFEVGSLLIPRINAAAGGGHSLELLGPEVGAHLSPEVATAAALLLFVGATGKSAQIPLYVWLPDAMEGPTPVSALIHAATMVTAGVYMVVRLGPVFEASLGPALTVVAWIGALTALWAALMASFEYDIKRVLAYSTISQLGYMFLANGVGAYSAGIFHLTTHAFFKALMFLGAGAVMHALAGETDMRRMGGLRRKMPITGWTFMAGWLAICGVIPFAGFFSKDAILASAWHEQQYALWGIGVATALLTAFYMSRLYFRVFEGRSRIAGSVHLHDAPPTMAAALIPLAVLSVAGGIINLPGALTLEHWLEPVVGHSAVPSGLTPWILAGVALAVASAGIALAAGMYLTRAGSLRRRRVYRRAPWLIDAARNKFYVDQIYGRAVVLPGKRLALYLTNVFDARVVDGAVNGVAGLIGRTSEFMRGIQTGYVRNYAAAFLVGVVVIFSVLLLRVNFG